MRVFSIDLLPRKLLGYIHDVLQRLRKKSVGGSVRDSCIKCYFELKVRGQNNKVRGEVTLTRSPLNSPRFIIANFYTVACTPHGVGLSQLGPPCCPRRIPFVFYRVQQARWFVPYICIYSRFVMNFQRIPPRFLRHVGWYNV